VNLAYWFTITPLLDNHPNSFVFTFGHTNHLTEIKRNGAVLESYIYDADGQRVKKTVGATSTYYYFPTTK
jgi:hypothetical protein